MTIACPAPDAALGVALRLSAYADCEARALGENGFQAMVGGPVAAGLLSALVTIFVALIGYRLILGESPTARAGVSGAVRLGLVLALTTAWPAFETLVYHVAVDGPNELASVILPASGLPAEGLDGRVQQAYDTIRLGAEQSPEPASQTAQPAAGAEAGSTQQQPSRSSPLGQRPQTASVFVVSTVGVASALRVAIGLLLALAPLAILALLFDQTVGLFSGWARAVTGAGLALIGATVVTALGLVIVESELGNVTSYGQGMSMGTLDDQALPTLVLCLALSMLVAIVTSFRMAGAIRLRISWPGTPVVASHGAAITTGAAPSLISTIAGEPGSRDGRTRATGIADALSVSVARERQAALAVATTTSAAGGSSRARTAAESEPYLSREALTMAPQARRTSSRRSRSGSMRDTMR